MVLCREGGESIAVGRLRSTVYGRMEEMSFRSGAAVSAGVLAALGAAIALPVVLGGNHSAGAAGAPSLGPAARSVAPPSPAPASASPSARPSLKRAVPAAPAESGQLPSQVTAVTTSQASPAPAAAGLATPRRPALREEGQPNLWDRSGGWSPWTPGQPDSGHRGLSGGHGDAAAGLHREGE
jgi:hypothetical protein